MAKSQAPRGAITLFLDMVAAERGGAANTLAAYRRDLDDLVAWLGRRKRSVEAATTADLRAYLGDLAARGFAATSVARRLSAIRQLYRFLYAEGMRTEDPAAIIQGPKRGRGAAEGALRRRGRPVDRVGAGGDRGAGVAIGGATAGVTAPVLARTPLRDRASHFRARGLAGVGGDA